MNAWKQKSLEFYEEMVPKYLEEKQILDDAIQQYYDVWTRYDSMKINEFPDKTSYKLAKQAAYRDRENRRDAFRSKWGWLQMYMYYDKLEYEKLKKDLDAEAIRKYDFIIERTNAIVGQITDASYLYIGPSGELNGYIVGTRGKAKVETIGTGGYNIQRFHFRTLIHKMQ